MLFFICLNTFEVIQKSVDEHEGIYSLKPAVTAMRNLPEYLNVYIGLEQGNLRQLDEQISGALRTLDRGLARYKNSVKDSIPDFLASWEMLKKVESDDEELLQKYLNFANSLRDVADWIGEGSRLILVSDMNTYYFVASVLTYMPEATMRLITMGNLVRQNLNEADALIEKYNSDLAASHAQGRRLTTSIFEGSRENIPLIMFAMTALQQMRNSHLFLVSDKDRISTILTSAMEENGKKAGEFDELEKRLGQYRNTVDVLSGLYGRIMGFNITNPCTAGEFLSTISVLNTDLCQLWTEAFDHLDAQIIRNTAAAKGRLIRLYT